MKTSIKIQIVANLENLLKIRQFVEQIANRLEADPAATSQVVMAVNEIATNIVLHGYRDRPGRIEIEVKQSAATLIVYLRDSAPPFDPTSIAPPNLDLPLERRPLGGLGMHMVRNLVDEVTYRRLPQGGNELTLKKQLAP
jgi:serine/threonine-protein kinase RsbW